MAARSATLVDRLALVPHALIGLWVGILRLAARPFTHDAKPPTALKDFVYAVLRYVLANSTVPQEKWVLPTTDKAYLWLAQQVVKHVSYDLEYGFGLPCKEASLEVAPVTWTHGYPQMPG
jgi:hypothetical protein